MWHVALIVEERMVAFWVQNFASNGNNGVEYCPLPHFVFGVGSGRSAFE